MEIGITKQTTKMIREIQAEQKEWQERNFGVKPRNQRTLLGMTEELGELSHAHLKSEQNIRQNEDHEAARRDAIGDIFIYMMGYCNDFDIDLQSVIEETWGEVKRRDWEKNANNGSV